MDAGGSPFPHGGSVDPMGIGLMIPVSRGRSGPSSPNFVCPINSKTCPGPMSMGVDSGNGIIPPVGSSGVLRNLMAYVGYGQSRTGIPYVR